MIEKIKILELVNQALEGSDKYLVNLKITPDNRIYVDIDGDNGVNIDDCITLSRAIESQLDREAEDFSLDVSSAGADQPLKLHRQYVKNIGRDVEALAADGEKTIGTLLEVGDDDFLLRIPATKRVAAREVRLRMADMKSVKVVIKF